MENISHNNLPPLSSNKDSSIPKPSPWFLRPFTQIPKYGWITILVGLLLIFTIFMIREIQHPQIFKLKAHENTLTLSIHPASTTLDNDRAYQIWMRTEQPVAFLNFTVTFDPRLVMLVKDIQLANASFLKLTKVTPASQANATGELTITSGFTPPVYGDVQGSYYEWYRQYGSETHHTGIDFGCPCGTIVKASADGTIILATDQWGEYGGSSVFIDHGLSVGDEHVYTFYTHLSSFTVENGQEVKKGDVIGFVGFAGTGCHLHWGISNKPPEEFLFDEEHAQDQPDHRGWINPENPPRGTFQIAELHMRSKTFEQGVMTNLSFAIPGMQIIGMDGFPFGAVLKQAAVVVNPTPTPTPTPLITPSQTTEPIQPNIETMEKVMSSFPAPSTDCAPVNGTIQYSPWTPCSKTCGGGVQTRIATCVNASCGGTCTEEPVIIQPCNQQDCQTTITIVAAGSPCQGAYPTMKLLIDNEVVATWHEVKGNPWLRQFSHYVYQTDRSISPKQIRVQFVNDCHKSFLEDRNLRVDKIMINGVSYETEDRETYSTGTQNSQGECKSGSPESEWLHCSGYFQY